MKNVVIIFIIAILGFSCKDKENGIQVEETYTLEELENNPNWVEIKDFEMLEIPCLNSHELEEKYYFKTNDEYQILKNHFYDNSSCTFNALPEVNFDKEEVIGVSYIGYQVIANDSLVTRIFINHKTTKLILKCELLLAPYVRQAISVINHFWIKTNKNTNISELHFDLIEKHKRE